MTTPTQQAELLWKFTSSTGEACDVVDSGSSKRLKDELVDKVADMKKHGWHVEGNEAMAVFTSFDATITYTIKERE